jgi:hypothetical protein
LPAHRVLDPSKLVGVARAPKRNDLTLVEQPADGKRQHRLPVALARKPVEAGDRIKIVSEPWLPEFGIYFAQIVREDVIAI